MNESLKAVLDAYLSPSKDVSLKTALADVKDLSSLIEEAKTHSEQLVSEFNSITDKEAKQKAADTVRALTEVMKTAVSEHNRQIAEAEVAASVDEAFTELKGLKLSEAKKPVEKPKTEETPLPVEGKEATPVNVEVSKQETPAVEVVSETTETNSAPAPAGELATAGQFSAAALRPQGSMPPALVRPSGEYSNVFSVNANGSMTDNRYTNAKDVVNALSETYRMYKSHIPGNGIMHKVAAYRRPENEEFSVYGNRDRDQETIDRIASTPLKLDATSGQFAAGWCAPEETLYELCPQISSDDGLVDLPTITARRGSLQYTKGPDFATLYADAAVGQVLTEVNVINEQVKTCIEIDCPDFTTVTLDVNPLCVTGNLLTHAGYPEYEQRFISEVMAANQHKINANIIGRMVTAATAVTVGAQPGFTGPLDTSSASQFLDYVSLYATWLRQQYRTRLDQVVEAGAPQWFRQHAAADLARRSGVDMLTAQSRLDAALTERYIRVQWLHDWQLLSATAATAANTRQATIQTLIYLPGTYVKAVNPVISLGVMHSSTQLAANQYTALFVEEGFAVFERCWDALAVTFPICPSGTTGAASGSCDVAAS